MSDFRDADNRTVQEIAKGLQGKVATGSPTREHVQYAMQQTPELRSRINSLGDTKKNQDLERKLEEARELIKAVAHIGIDWGYGKFELNQDHIDKARKLYEAHDQLKEQG